MLRRYSGLLDAHIDEQALRPAHSAQHHLQILDERAAKVVRIIGFFLVTLLIPPVSYLIPQYVNVSSLPATHWNIGSGTYAYLGVLLPGAAFRWRVRVGGGAHRHRHSADQPKAAAA